MLNGVAPYRSHSIRTGSCAPSARTQSSMRAAWSAGSASGTISKTVKSGRRPSTCWAQAWNAAPRGSCMTRAMRVLMACSCAGAHGLNEGLDETAGDVETRLLGDFDETGGAGDVDLGDVVADHVQADQQQAAFAQLPADGPGQFEIARPQRLDPATSDGGQA